MIKVRRGFFILLWLFPYLSSVSQNKIDSLKNSLVTSSSEIERIETMNNLCVAYWVVNLDSAKMYAQQAMSLLDMEEQDALSSKVIMNLGTVYLYEGDYKTANFYYNKSLEIARFNSNKQGIHKCLNNIGLVYKNVGNYAEAINFLNESLEIKRELNIINGIGNTLSNIGNIYVLLKDYENALIYYEEALEVNMTLNENRMRVNSLNQLGELYRLKGNPSKAKQYYLRAKTEAENAKNLGGLSITYLGLADIYLFNGKYDSALSNYNQSLHLNLSLGNNKSISVTQYKIANLYFQKKQIDSAYHHLTLSHEIAERLNQNELLLNNFKLFSSIYEAQEDFRKALYTSTSYSDLKEQIYNDALFKELTNIKLDQQSMESNRTIQEKNAKLSQSRILILVISLFALIMIFIGYVLYSKSKFNQKLNRLLEEKGKGRTKLLNESNIRLKLTNQELDNFIYKASHDLRGPVARIKGLLNLNMQVGLEYIELFARETDEMDAVLKKLNKVHEVNLHEISIASASIHDQIQATIDISYPFHPGSAYINEVPKEIIWNVDKFLLDIIIGSLIENAQSNAIDQQHYIKITAHQKDNILNLQVIDNGIGIPEQAINNIFDMFYQTSSKASSSGITLYMAKKAVERFGGEIKLSSPKDDTIFEFHIPVI